MNSKILLIIVLLLISVFLIFKLFLGNKNLNSTQIKIKDKTYNLEIAKTVLQKANGLSKREKICENCGVIFIFNNDNIQPFWMKDTLIPLDMIWINSQGIVVSLQTAQPEPNTPFTKLKIYKNDKPAKYVIEINANDAQKLNLNIGDKINLTL